MGSYNMAFNKILFVLVAAGGSSAWAQSSLFGFSNNFNNAPATPSTTPVPILRYVDNQNIDGSYTYGYEAADGTYKLETRFVDGRVKGKYGYFDPEGVLREASYGAEAGRGFEPKIAGVELLPPTIVNAVESKLADQLIVKGLPQSKVGEIKIVNGRRVILKKRVKPFPAPAHFLPPVQENKLNDHDEHLRKLKEHRQNILLLQQRQPGARQESPRSFNGFKENPEIFRTAPVSDPYLSGVDLRSGSFTY